MIGRAKENLGAGCYEIFLGDRDHCYTFELKQHPVSKDYSNPSPTSMVSWQLVDVLKALGEALIELEIMKDHATDAELKATKYHLEDMRKLVLK